MLLNNNLVMNNKIKIIVNVKDNAFLEKVKNVRSIANLNENIQVLNSKDDDQFNGDIVFVDTIPLNGFNKIKSKVVIVSSDKSSSKEYLAARSGAKGFITKNITESSLIDVIKCIYSGEIWMTRLTIAKVFEEYVKIVRN